VPELPEVECYRRLAERTVGRRVTRVDLPDAWYVKGPEPAEAIAAALVGRRIAAVRRVGKLLILHTDADAAVGLRFGMTGRLLVDGRAALEHLEYGSAREVPQWDRVVVKFGRGDLRVRDPRRLGGVQLDPDLSRLGVDALAATPAQLRGALATSRAPLKLRLMDQSRLAGIGNLLADEILWRAALDPARPAGTLRPTELRRLHRHLAPTIWELIERGGSHTGDLQPERRPGGRCPRDEAALQRRMIGGRTTWSCPAHQR
jgi:formamidopyrimidine-DNA glycosylase